VAKQDQNWDAQSTAFAAIPTMGLVALLTKFPKFPWQQQAISPVLAWWHPITIAAAIAVAALAVSAVTRRAMPHCAMFAVAVTAIGGWCSWIGSHDWSVNAIVAGLGIIASVMVCQIVVGGMSPKAADPDKDDDTTDNRPKSIRDTEAVIRKAIGVDVSVTSVTSSGPRHSRDMMHVTAIIPAGTNTHDITTKLGNLPAAMHLRPGCSATAAIGDHQGEIVFNIMLKNTLSTANLFDEPKTPSSIYEPFQVAVDSLGNPVEICLRLYSMLIGGSPDAGKTTLIRAIATHFMRCQDTLIWMIDLNGGGASEPFLTTYADGRSKRPGIDWVATEPWEALCMLYAATEIAKWRKMSPEAIRRKRQSGDEVLRVDKDFPAIIVIIDEGKEMQNVPGAIGALIRAYTNEIGEIGRNEAVRVILSALRGTSDAVDKAFRIVAAIRFCLQLIEHGEYIHFLDETPPKTAIVDRGVGWIRTKTGEQLRIARGMLVDRTIIDDMIIKTDAFRAVIDRWGGQIIDNLDTIDVIGALKDNPEIQEAMQDSQAMQDLADGALYTNRWGRLKDKIDAMGAIGDDIETPAIAPRTRLRQPEPAVYRPADIVSSYLADTIGNLDDEPDDDTDESADVTQIGAGTTRAAILAALKPGPARVVEITDAVATVTQQAVSKQRVSTLLGKMASGDRPAVSKLPDGRWSLAGNRPA